MARVRVLFLGGTISMTPSMSPDAAAGSGATPRLGSAEILESLAARIGEDLAVEGVDLCRVGSSHLTFEHLLDVTRAARKAVDEGVDGVVVVQGTDSMEESGWFLDLLWPYDVPVVFTGAMRNPALPGADGAANLLAALTVAADPRWREQGVLLLLNDEVHAARHVAKRHTSSPAAFESPGAGPLGRMLEGRAAPTLRVARRSALPVPETVPTRVPVHFAAVGEDPAVLRALGLVADGLVVAGFGAGHVKADVAEAAGELAARIPVVLASRAGSGSVHTRTYGGAGSEEDLLGKGLVNGGQLAPLKARVLLALLLGGGADRDTIRAAFDEHGG